MTDREISRREALAAIVAAVVGAIALAISLLAPPDRKPPGPQTPTETPAAPETGQPTATEVPPGEDIRDYGATVDGTTDDTAAILRAVDAASPGGTVYLPAGDILVSGFESDGKAIQLDASNADLTITGAGAGDGGTTLNFAGGHEGVHGAIDIRTDRGESIGTVRLEKFAVVGNKSEQGQNPGIGIHTEANGEFVMRDCRVSSWRNAGLKLSGAMKADVQYCSFDNNGLRSNGGHDISPNQAWEPTETLVKHVLCTNSGGVSIDVGQDNDAQLQTVLIDRCVLKDSRGSLKLSTENKSTTVRNTQMLGNENTTIPVKVNPTDVSIDDLALDNVLIDGGGWPGIDLPCPGRLRLDDVAIKNIDQDNVERGRDRGGIYTRGIGFGSSGRVSLHNIGRNNDSIVLNIEGGAGVIGEVVYGNAEELGTTQGVEIAQSRQGEPLDPDVVHESEVGPRTDAN